MSAGPTVTEILEAVGDWLEDGAQGADAFQGRVAANAIGIVRRELALWPQAEARAIARLESITGKAGAFEQLEALLCAKLGDGSIAVGDPGVLEHLRATALDRLAIDQPNYRSLLS
jgi:hypothetical protein